MQRVHAHGRRARRGVCGRSDRTPKRCAFGEARLALRARAESIIPRRRSGHFLRRPGALARDAPPFTAPMRMHSLHAPSSGALRQTCRSVGKLAVPSANLPRLARVTLHRFDHPTHSAPSGAGKLRFDQAASLAHTLTSCEASSLLAAAPRVALCPHSRRGRARAPRGRGSTGR